MIATALPVEGAPLAVPGPYKVDWWTGLRLAGPCGLPPCGSHSVPGQRHAAADGLGQRRVRDQQHSYGGFLTTIASHGFLVMATAAEPGADGGRSTADNLRKAIEWAEAENKRAGSPLNGKIALDRVAVMGQSCGGFLSIELGADPRVDTIGVFNSGVQGDNIARLTALHVPVLLINGHERDFLMASSKATFDAIEKLPTFAARVTAPATRRPSIIPVAASSRTSPRTGCDGSSRETSRPRRCSWARTAASARTRPGTRRRSTCSNSIVGGSEDPPQQGAAKRTA